MSIGAIFVSTGGKKVVRAVRTFQAVEPELPVYVLFDISGNSWRSTDGLAPAEVDRLGAKVQSLGAHPGYINGAFNAAMRLVAHYGHTHSLLLHDDIVFSQFYPYPLSEWCRPALLETSGIAFAHLEAFKVCDEPYARRPPAEWDAIDLESEELWRQLGRGIKRQTNQPFYPEGFDFFVQYEGSDSIQRWNRLGPSAQVIPVATWEQVGGFDEACGVQYDEDYPGECFRRQLTPVYAVPNFPFLHLHNQSHAPWGDPAPEPWGREAAHMAKFGTDRRGLWRDDWLERWPDDLSRRESARAGIP